MNKKILIVEDDADIQYSVKLFLEGEGYTVYTADNGYVALEIINKIEMPHLILLDMKMPVMNGWQFALEFLNRYNHLSPIVVMTAAPDAEMRSKEIGAVGWVGKPFNFDELIKQIKKYERSL